MAKKDPVADALARLAALRTIDDPAQLANGIEASLKERSGYVVSRVAAFAAERGVRAAIPAIITRLTRLLNDPKPDDPNGAAALELTRALVTLSAGYEAEDVALVAVKYVRWEPVYGGSVDVGVSVRGNAAILLAAMGSQHATRAAIELLAEADRPGTREQTNWPARADAARALTMISSDAAAAVLRFKLLLADDDTNVLADCLAGLLTLERDVALPLATRMLLTADESQTEAALLALGAWRDTRAFTTLLAHADRFLISQSRDLFLASIAMTRQSAAIDYLLDLAATGNPTSAPPPPKPSNRCARCRMSQVASMPPSRSGREKTQAAYRPVPPTSTTLGDRPHFAAVYPRLQRANPPAITGIRSRTAGHPAKRRYSSRQITSRNLA